MVRRFSHGGRKETETNRKGKSVWLYLPKEKLPVMGRGLVQKKTLPKPLYTEATLLGAMETCGKDITDEEAKEAVKDAGIGTPATRAAIITTLFKGTI